MNRLLMVNLFSVMMAGSVAFSQTTETKNLTDAVIDTDQLTSQILEQGGAIIIPPGQSTDIKSTSGMVTKYSADKTTAVVRVKQPGSEITTSVQSASNDRQQRIDEHQARIRAILTQRAAHGQVTTNTTPILRDGESSAGLSEKDKRILEHQERIREILRQAQQRRATERAPAKESR